MRTVVLSRPEVRNAVDPERAYELHAVFVAFDTDDAADVAVLWGEGGAFCAGADLKSVAKRRIATPENRHTHRSLEFPTDGGPVPRGPWGQRAWGRSASPSLRQSRARLSRAAWSSPSGPTAGSWRKAVTRASTTAVGRTAKPCVPGLDRESWRAQEW